MIMRTNEIGSAIIKLNQHDCGVFFDVITYPDTHINDPTSNMRVNGVLHLHAFEHVDGLTGFNLVSRCYFKRDDNTRHVRGHPQPVLDFGKHLAGFGSRNNFHRPIQIGIHRRHLSHLTYNRIYLVFYEQCADLQRTETSDYPNV